MLASYTACKMSSFWLHAAKNSLRDFFHTSRLRLNCYRALIASGLYALARNLKEVSSGICGAAPKNWSMLATIGDAVITNATAIESLP